VSFDRARGGTLSAVRSVDDVSVGLTRSYLFEDLTAEQLGPLAKSVRTRALVRNECLCCPGDSAEELWVVLSGELKAYVVDSEGNEVVHAVLGPGMTTGEPGYFSDERTRILFVAAIKATAVIVLGRRQLDPFMADYPVIKDRVLAAVATTSRWQTAMLSSAARRPLRDRLILRLLELVDASPERTSGHAVTPKISQSTLAGMIGVSRENVNRALAALAIDGAIRQEEGRYVLVDEDRLRREMSRDWPLPARRDRRTERPAGSS
jgi:CRP/FNR family transcriptional regulator, cyclic AMP receptor protein